MPCATGASSAHAMRHGILKAVMPPEPARCIKLPTLPMRETGIGYFYERRHVWAYCRGLPEPSSPCPRAANSQRFHPQAGGTGFLAL